MAERDVEAVRLPLVAAGDVHMHVRSRRRRCRTCSPRSAWASRWRNAGSAVSERRAQPALRMRLAQLYPPELLAETVAIAERRFAGDIALRIPRKLVPENETPASWLRKLTEDGLRWRFPAGVPPKVAALVEHELRLIAELGYEPFFLTVHDVVRFARARGSCARAAARRRTRWCAMRCASPKSTPRA